MCEANAYIDEDGKEELFLAEVNILRPEGNEIYLKSIFGEQKTIKATIKEISLLNHRIVLQKK